MKNKLSKVLAILLIIASLTISVSAVTYDPYNPNVSYENYLANNDTTTRTFTGSTMIGLLARKYGLDVAKIGESTIKNSYYTHYWPLETIDRTTMLINIMRVNLLIPDLDSYNIDEYPWTDIPENFSELKLAYINYAKQLGITNGTGEYTFGFTQPATYEQFDTFVNNISKIDNIEQYQAKCSINVIDKTNSGLDKLAKPLIIEYFNTLPDKLVTEISKYTFYIDDYEIPEYVNAIGLTNTQTKTIEVLGTAKTLYGKDFHETMIHEFGHAVNDISGVNLIRNVDNYSEILDVEMPRLGVLYRSYATTNKYEYFACAWYWYYYKGAENFTYKYPETAILFEKILNMYK